VSPGGLFSTPFYAGYEDYELKLDEDSTFLDKRWYIPGLIEGDRKIIENDIVSFYGSFAGLVEMKLISGSKEFVPMLNFEYYENLSDVN